MATEKVICGRKINLGADDIWSQLRGFDVSWHPLVKSCRVFKTDNGAIHRAFETIDGGRYLEQRTYISDTDRVLSYTALSGIRDASSYHAEVRVKGTGKGKCRVTWSAAIDADIDKIEHITKGTRLVFESGLDQLERSLGQVPGPICEVFDRTDITEGAIPVTPRLSYLTGTDAPTTDETLILFLHGIGGQASNWAEQIQTFGGTYKVAALNLRGYGDSELGGNQTQIDDHCRDILRVMDHFGSQQVILFGLSMGSWIATSFAMRHSAKLKGLVLAAGCTGMSEADPNERENFLKSREAPLNNGLKPADFAEGVVNLIAGPSAPDAVKAVLHKSMSDITSETYRDALNCFCNPAELFDFSKIRCPVLMVTGEWDRLAPPDEIRGVSRRIFKTGIKQNDLSDVRFEVVSNAGHVCNLENPKAFNLLLSDFLSRF